MDFPRLKVFNAYWQHSPPTHIVTARIGAALGVRFDAAESEGGAAPEAVSPQAEAGDILDMLTAGAAPEKESHG